MRHKGWSPISLLVDNLTHNLPKFQKDKSHP
jgi:hypothetical protein